MASASMTRCEEKRLFKVDDKKVWRWVEVAVTSLAGDGSRSIRCMHCHGLVKLKTPRPGEGSPSVVTHVTKDDSVHCTAGDRVPTGACRSSKPVE